MGELTDAAIETGLYLDPAAQSVDPTTAIPVSEAATIARLRIEGRPLSVKQLSVLRDVSRKQAARDVRALCARGLVVVVRAFPETTYQEAHNG